MLHSKTHFGIGLILSFLIVLTASCVLIFLPEWRSSHLVARRWQYEIANLPDGQVLPQLRQIAQLGQAGVDVIVEEMGNRRDSVSRDARRVISETLQQWQLLSIDKSTRNVVRLAMSLSESIDQFEEPSRDFSSEIALRILFWPAESNGVQRMELVEHCERILRVTGNDNRSSAELIFAGEATDKTSLLPNGIGETARLPVYADSPIPLDDLPTIAGGDVPFEVAAIPSLDPIVSRSKFALQPEVRHGKGTKSFLQVDTATPSDEQSEPNRLVPPIAAKSPRERAKPILDHQSVKPGLRLSWKQPQHRHASLPTDWREMDDLDVMRVQHHEHTASANAARGELIRRGYNETELQLAWLLTDSAPESRLRLVDTLPRTSVDASRWLHWLTQDEDPRVRSAAITIMATSQDPRLASWLRRLHIEEKDDALRRQIEQILARLR